MDTQLIILGWIPTNYQVESYFKLIVSLSWDKHPSVSSVWFRSAEGLPF